MRQQGRRLVVRLCRVSYLAATIFAIALATATAASAQPLGPPGAFRLEASNSYSIAVRGYQFPGKPSLLEMVVRKRGALARYFAPATVTDTSIRADLGGLGEIDVAFRPSGEVQRARGNCDRTSTAFDAGFYEGTIEFNGEEGYTQVSTTRVEGDLQFFLEFFCPELVGRVRARGVPGAELRAWRRELAGPSFAASKNHPAGRTTFSASVFDQRGEVEIQRFVGVKAESRAFHYASKLQSASVTPPAPFSGSATFRRGVKSARRWTGSLEVDFPGRSNVRLAGGPRRVELFHGYREAFRPSPPG